MDSKSVPELQFELIEQALSKLPPVYRFETVQTPEKDFLLDWMIGFSGDPDTKREEIKTLRSMERWGEISKKFEELYGINPNAVLDPVSDSC